MKAFARRFDSKYKSWLAVSNETCIMAWIWQEMVCANVKLNNKTKQNIIYYSVYTQGKLLTHSDQRNIGIRDCKTK